MTIKKRMKKLADRLCFDTVESYQVMAMESICDGRDTFFVSSSSCEKSELVLYAALLNEKRPIVVIEPTISLINLQMYNVKFLEEPYRATSLTECNRKDHNELLKKFKNHKFNVLYVTPDRLKETYFRKAMEEIEPWLVVVNEAHLVQQDWGKRFRSPYLEIKKFINSLSHRPTMLAMTGTAPPTDREDIWDNLGLIDPKEIILSADKSNVSVIVENHSNYVSKTKKARLEYLLECVKKNIEKYGGKGVIVYALTPHDVETIADYLDVRFIGEVTMSHGDMEKEERTINEELFLMDKYQILVTTCDFEQGFRPGVDKVNAHLVVHFGLPLSVVDYYQQLGRFEHIGNSSKTIAVVIYDKELMKQNEELISSAPKKTQKRMKKRQKELEKIITGDNCIIQGMLKVLGEEHGCCGRCSVCRRKMKNIDKTWTHKSRILI